MNSLETLKQELLLQKLAIESKGGTVIVAGNNPSPSEITAGINSIVVSNSSTRNVNLSNAELDSSLNCENSLQNDGTGESVSENK